MLLIPSVPVEAGPDLFPNFCGQCCPLCWCHVVLRCDGGPVSSSPFGEADGSPLGKVPRLLLPDWQLTRGLHEGSILLAREAFSAGSIEGLSIALWAV